MQKLDALFKENAFEFQRFWVNTFGPETSRLVQKLLVWSRNFSFGLRASLGNLLHSSPPHSSTLPFAPGNGHPGALLKDQCPVPGNWNFQEEESRHSQGLLCPSHSPLSSPFTLLVLFFLTSHFLHPSLCSPSLPTSHSPSPSLPTPVSTPDLSSLSSWTDPSFSDTGKQRNLEISDWSLQEKKKGSSEGKRERESIREDLYLENSEIQSLSALLHLKNWNFQPS